MAYRPVHQCIESRRQLCDPLQVLHNTLIPMHHVSPGVDWQWHTWPVLGFIDIIAHQYVALSLMLTTSLYVGKDLAKKSCAT